jgi:hypothetical protein
MDTKQTRQSRFGAARSINRYGTHQIGAGGQRACDYSCYDIVIYPYISIYIYVYICICICIYILLGRSVPVDGELALRLLLDVAQGLRYLHEWQPHIIHAGRRLQRI